MYFYILHRIKETKLWRMSKEKVSGLYDRQRYEIWWGYISDPFTGISLRYYTVSPFRLWRAMR